MKYKSPHKATYLFFITLIIIVLSVAVFVLINKEVHIAETSKATDQHKTTPASTEHIGDVHTYHSEKMDIRFDYVASYGKQNVLVKEIDNKVYIYSESSTRKKDPTKGKYVQIFTKDKNMSLENAVHQYILKNYSTTNCPITAAILSKSYSTATRSYAQITVNTKPNASRLQKKEAFNKCPQEYTYTGSGLMYFMIDDTMPDKLFFFNIGQDNFSASKSEDYQILTWDQTVRIE